MSESLALFKKSRGEKAPDEAWARTFYRDTVGQILRFLERDGHAAEKGWKDSALM
jgi:hypothetical protein